MTTVAMVFVASLFGLFGLFGCTSEMRTDVSHQPEFKPFIGNQFEIIGTVDAYGIRSYSEAAVEYVTLVPLPGIDGPEVGYRIRLPTGSRITVKKVIRTNRIFDPPMSYEVALEGTPLPQPAPIRLELFRGNEGEGPMQLNPLLYRKLVRTG